MSPSLSLDVGRYDLCEKAGAPTVLSGDVACLGLTSRAWATSRKVSLCNGAACSPIVNTQVEGPEADNDLVTVETWRRSEHIGHRAVTLTSHVL